MAEVVDFNDREYPPPGEPARQLPPDVDLVGRDADFERLLRSCTPPQGHKRAPAVLILGEAGIGKSALAIRFAHSLTTRYPGHQLYRNFQHHAPPLVPLTPAQVLRSFLVDLGRVPREIPDNLEELAERFREVVQKEELLILLDNVAAESRIDLFFPQEHTSQIIITSRLPLNISDTPAWPLQYLAPDQALRLFAKVSESDWPLPADRLTATNELVRECDGSPLAVRILAARARGEQASGLTRMLRRIRDLHEAAAADGTPMSPLTAVLTSCYQWLETDEAQLFRRLSVVPGSSFERTLAGHLAQSSPLEAGVALRHLLQAEFVQPTLDPAYFELHSKMRELGRDQLLLDEGEPSLRQHLVNTLDFYLRHAESCDRVLQPQSEDPRHGNVQARATLQQRGEALAWMRAERFNLVAAVNRACQQDSVDGNAQRAWRLCRALASFFEIQSDWENWEQTHGNTLAALDALADKADSSGRAHVLRGLGRLRRALRHWQEAIDAYREAIALFRERDKNEFVGMTLLSLGDVYRYTRSWDAAVNCLEASHSILARSGYRRGRAIALRSLGAVHRLRGDFDEAEMLYREAITILASVGDERWQAATTLSLCDVRLDQDDTSQRAPLAECLEVFERMGDQHWRALTLRSLGEACRLSGDFDSALGYLGESAHAMKESGDALWQAQVDHCLGLVHLDKGQLEEALKSFEQSLAVFIEERDTLWQGRAHVSIAKTRTRLAAGAATVEENAVQLRAEKRASCRAWPLLIEQGAKDDLGKLD